MNETPNFNEPMYAGENRTMIQIMLDAVTKPTLENYERTAQAPNATIANGALWLFLALLVGALVGGLIGLPFQGNLPQQLGPLFDNASPEMRRMLLSFFQNRFNGSFSTFSMICGAPISAIFILVSYFIGVGIQHWIARMFGGTGEFRKLFFVTATFATPISLVTSVLGNIPVVNCIAALVSFYSIFLSFLSIRAVHKLESSKAIIVLLIPIIIGCVLVLCLGGAIFAILVQLFSNAGRF